ncbi:unnamed protein product [Blepharisma stoltei]|uniref:Uncharacterized protein n=1 Tax=Blepharisma stoltei TaxID=1481888 RepID=A0AAU9J9H7_9CILI|nr:unnamed protein product [Blepharisma stoltei]
MMGLIEGYNLLSSGKQHIIKTESFACKIDLTKSSEPLNKIGSNEYFRALTGHNTLRKCLSDKCLPQKVEYEIDKVVRKQMNELPLSQMISKQLSFEDEEFGSIKYEDVQDFENNISLEGYKRFNPALTEKLNSLYQSQKNPDKIRKLEYDEWLQKKQLEKSLKQKLINDALYKEREQEINELNNKIKKHNESIIKTRQWEKQKIKEQRKKQKEKQEETRLIEEINTKKKIEAKNHYKEWLMDNLRKLKQERKKKREEKKQKNEELKKIEEEKWERKRIAEKAYKKWLFQKSVTQSFHPSQSSQNTRLRKTPMLAYSPNKKSVSSIHDELEKLGSKILIPDLVTESNSSEDEKYQTEISSQKPPRPKAKNPQIKEQYRLDDYQVFEELSSIRKSPKAIDKHHVGEESFISDIEGDEVMD